MGLLERFRTTTVATESWHPPAAGRCRCERHVEDLLDVRVALADGSGEVSVADLVASGALTTVPTPHALWVEGNGPNERRGPYHWRVVHQRSLDPFLDPSAPVSFDDAVFVQPGIDAVLWLEDRTLMALGAPGLCGRGVQAGLVAALTNPRLRRND